MQRVAAKEILKRYASGERNFQRLNLRGANFKGKDLSDADFSECDIRGANFSRVNLTGASFRSAKAGLQKRWAVALGLVNLLLAAAFAFIAAVFVGSSAATVFNSSFAPAERIAYGISLVATYPTFAMVSARRGIFTGLGALSVAVAIAGPIAVTTAGQVAGAVAITGAVAGAVASAVAVAVAIMVAMTGAVAVARAIPSAVAVVVMVMVARAVSGAIAATVTVLMALLGTYLGWRALREDSRKPLLDPWLRDFVLYFPALVGTRFVAANLTNADFSGARLKNANFHQAHLRGTSFRNAQKLHLACPGNTYLKPLKILNLLVTGTFPNRPDGGTDFKNFDRLDLRDINLSGLDLTDTSFIATDLSHANLAAANLTRARLVQTQLDAADLSCATLSGAFIEDWNITTETKLDGIICSEIFMRLPTSDNPEPYRKPDDRNKTFAEGEFTEYIRPLQQTLDLYHNHVGDPRAIALALQKLRDDNPNANIDVVSVERRGKEKQALLVRTETAPAADPSGLHQQYFQTYDALKGLPSETLQALLAEKDDRIQKLEAILEAAVTSPNKTMPGDTYNFGPDTKIGSMNNQGYQANVAAEVHGNQAIGNPDTANYAETIQEIQQLLARLSDSGTEVIDISEEDSYILAGQAAKEIKADPDFKQRAIAAAKGGALAALKNTAPGKVVAGMIEGWTKA